MCIANAHVAAVCEEWKRRVCTSCFAVAEARLDRCCSLCQQCFYCSEACQEQHRPAHERVCPALQRWAQMKKAGKETMAVLRLLLEALALEHQPTATQSASVGESVVGAPSFTALQHHPATYDTPKEASDWARCCVAFRGVVEACEWCPWRVDGADSDSCHRLPPHDPPSDAELHALASRIDSNCFGIFREGHGDGAPRLASNGRNVDLLGRGVYLDAALFNHSCAPNCSVTSGARRLSVVCEATVAAGTELTIAYVDTEQPLATRQKHLRMHYHFECACVRCVAEAAPGATAAKLSYRSGGGARKAPPSKREKRERREQKATVRSGTGGCHATEGCGAVSEGAAASAAAVEVRVLVDLRVLLKLAKAPSNAKEARRRKGAPLPTHVPTVCMRLRTSAVVLPG